MPKKVCFISTETLFNHLFNTIYSRNVQLLFSFKTMFIVQVRVPICSKRYIEEIEIEIEIEKNALSA